MEGEKLMGITEAAAAIGVSTATLRRAVRLGQLAGQKIGNTWLVTLSAAKAWKDNPVFHDNTPKKYRGNI